MVRLRNLLLFAICALWKGTPFHLWRQVYRDIEAEHLAQVRKAVWELKKAGKVWEDEDGRLWPK